MALSSAWASGSGVSEFQFHLGGALMFCCCHQGDVADGPASGVGWPLRRRRAFAIVSRTSSGISPKGGSPRRSAASSQQVLRVSADRWSRGRRSPKSSTRPTSLSDWYIPNEDVWPILRLETKSSGSVWQTGVFQDGSAEVLPVSGCCYAGVRIPRPGLGARTHSPWVLAVSALCSFYW